MASWVWKLRDTCSPHLRSGEFEHMTDNHWLVLEKSDLGASLALLVEALAVRVVDSRPVAREHHCMGPLCQT